MTRLFSGLGIRIRQQSGKVIISADATQRHEHPWQVRCVAAPRHDDPSKTEWRAYVRPGFVNGRDVTVSALRAVDEKSAPTPQDVPLTDEEAPYLVLTAWRNPLLPLGFSATLEGEMVATPGEGYPPFFGSVGVRPAARGGTLEAVDSEPDRTRELRACDLVLITPRIAARLDINVQDPLSTGATVSVSTSFSNDAMRSMPPHRLVTHPKWFPPREPDAVEWLLGTAVEPQTDELKIATVWMVSPPDVDPASEPDASWTPYPQHFVFWNLMHASRNEAPSAPQPPVRIQTGLPWADFLGNLASVAVNNTLARVQALFGAVSLKGEYWTI